MTPTSPAAVLAERGGCYFSVVQFVPDPLGFDRYAIGMIAVAEDGSRTSMRFIDSWERAQAFGGNVTFLHEWIADTDEAPPTSLDDLHTMHHDYQNLLQITEPDYASVDVDEWIRDYAHLFVRDLTASLTNANETACLDWLRGTNQH